MQKEFKNKFNVIACIDKNNCIGLSDAGKSDLIYKIKSDLIYFKNQTLNNIIIMGFNTFKSINNKAEGSALLPSALLPLPNRINIVICDLTRLASNEITYKDNLYFVNSLKSGLDLSIELANSKLKIFIIGGEKIYKEFMTNYGYSIDTIYLTEVDESYLDTNKLEIDVSKKLHYFPNFDKSLYKKEESNTLFSKSNIKFKFTKYVHV